MSFVAIVGGYRMRLLLVVSMPWLIAVIACGLRGCVVCATYKHFIEYIHFRPLNLETKPTDM